MVFVFLYGKFNNIEIIEKIKSDYECYVGHVIVQKYDENNDIIDNKDDIELKEIIRSQNSNISKKLGYYLFISKKYLWNNYEPKLARENLRKAIKLNPFYFLSYFLFFISFFSKNTIVKLYKSVK